MVFDQFNIFPVMGQKMSSQNSLVLDFSAKNPSLEKIDLSNTEKFNEHVFSQLDEQGKDYGYGGYLENRIIYLRSKHFQQGESRCMHLGVDIWAKAFHPVYAPLNAAIHSFKNNDNFGDYGPTIVLAHQIEGQEFYTLYGHLSLNSLEDIKVGQKIEKGTAFCELGPYPENGDWPPHLHFQLITDMAGRIGDFPGVCAPSELSHFQKICLNPYDFI